MKETSTEWLIDIDLDGYGLTASGEDVQVTGPSQAVCQAIMDQFKALSPEVRLALAETEPHLASSVLQVAWGVHRWGGPVGKSAERDAPGAAGTSPLPQERWPRDKEEFA
jgi:hypothetical protein